MTVRNVNMLVWILSSVMGTASVSAFVGLLYVPTSVPGAPKPRADVNPRFPEHEPAPGASFDSLAANVSGRQWRAPLFDPAPAAPAPTLAPSKMPELHLIGTATERGHAFALLAGSDGRATVRRVGESLQDATLVEIQSDSVIVSFGGQQAKLLIERRRLRG